ncbi:MAG: serine acetyltransferase [Deltaproteobacteria bacterium]|nr:serine acetyltransferase [Deltaproteobacteria bacterium]
MSSPEKGFQEWLTKDLGHVVRQFESRLHNTCSLCSIAGKIGISTRTEVYAVLDALLESLFPGCYSRENIDPESLDAFVEERLRYAATLSFSLIQNACRFEKGGKESSDHNSAEKAFEAVRRLIEEFPEIHSMLMADLQAAYEGDPAARSVEEVVISYPFVEAIATHRIAHSFYASGVPFLPRMMSERAHSNTGIDIHPGAKIGKGFFIDHGTGVVIGETTVIGEQVKMYQGVTLGALSFASDEHGQPIKGVKRHPNIEDHVILYAQATILGGQTTVGHHSVIGGNVWLTKSVPPYSKIYNVPPDLRVTPNENINGFDYEI